jgi:hypothetical protein
MPPAVKPARDPVLCSLLTDTSYCDALVVQEMRRFSASCIDTVRRRDGQLTELAKEAVKVNLEGLHHVQQIRHELLVRAAMVLQLVPPQSFPHKAFIVGKINAAIFEADLLNQNLGTL